MTEAEKRLWRELRELNLPHRFRRQHPIGKYIVDFACPAAKLVIELDGGQHGIQHGEDEVRIRKLARAGYRVIRFWNNQLIEHLPGVLQTIRLELEISLSALGNGDGRGEVGEAREVADTHLTLPLADATGPLPLRPKGRRGQKFG
jgi:very-short-patch-repair endonuclease